MIQIKEGKWYTPGVFAEYTIDIKVKDASVQDMMKLKGIANRAAKEIEAILENLPEIKKEAATRHIPPSDQPRKAKVSDVQK